MDKRLLAILCALFTSIPSCKLPGKGEPAVPSPNPRAGKMVLALPDIRNVRIELPDQSTQDFGRDLQARLTTYFTESNRYIVMDSPRSRAVRTESDDFEWNGSLTPAATLRISVEELSFTSGNRGNRSFHGFSRTFKTPFNDGTMLEKNEYPLRTVKFEPNWFDRTFDRKGTENFGSQAGLDLGEGFELDVLFAYFRIKHAQFVTSLGLDVEVDAPLAGEKERRLIDVQGSGYFYDIVGGYLQYSGGIRVARSDAMDQALKLAIAGSLQAIERGVNNLPLVARVDGIVRGTQEFYLLGTGFEAGVKKGTVYESVDQPSLKLVVDRSVPSGAIAILHEGDSNLVREGMVLREFRKLQAEPRAKLATAELASAETVTLPQAKLPKIDLGQWVDELSRWDAVKRSVVGTVSLIYRAWRYKKYDQSYKDDFADRDNDPEPENPEEADSERLLRGFEHSGNSQWAALARKQPWAKQIGLDRAAEMHDLGFRSPVVAIIDSGVDYNHKIIHDQTWWNFEIGAKAQRGWDFISNDPRAYDDGYHGTQVAGAVLAIAPFAKIMPVKAINPFGVTTSAALFASFKYAVDHGAHIIITGWATRLHSKALRMGVEYARSRGVLVVAAAGDRGEFLTDSPTYPASLSMTLDNVLSVTGVDLKDDLVRVRGKAANFGTRVVGMSAPGQDIQVAEPRNKLKRDTGTGLAAAMAAGAIARNLALGGAVSGTPAEWIRKLQDQAARIKAIDCYIKDGYRLRIE